MDSHHKSTLASLIRGDGEAAFVSRLFLSIVFCVAGGSLLVSELAVASVVGGGSFAVFLFAASLLFVALVFGVKAFAVLKRFR